MPDGFTGAEAADRDTVLDDIGDDVDLGESLDEPAAVLLDRRLVERAEAAAEGNQIAVGELLIAEQYDRVVEPRLVDGGERRFTERTEIDAADFRAERSAGWDDVDVRLRAGSRGGAWHGHVEYGRIPNSLREFERWTLRVHRNRQEQG